MSRTLSRRELLVTGAIGGAALALPLSDAAAAVRRKQPRDSVHCLPAYDRFRVREVLLSCSFASFSPDGQRIALETPRGIEIHTRADGTRALATPPGFTLAGNAWHPDGAVVIVSGPAEDGSGPYLHAITAAGMTRMLPTHPGAARSAVFSPDGRKVAFTYVNRFAHQVCRVRRRGPCREYGRARSSEAVAAHPRLRRTHGGVSFSEVDLRWGVTVSTMTGRRSATVGRNEGQP